MGYDITLRNETRLSIDEADAFTHDRTMTTFYRTGNARRTVDCWATALASIRTEEVMMIVDKELSVFAGA